MLSKCNSIEEMKWYCILGNSGAEIFDFCTLFHYTKAENKSKIIRKNEICFQATSLNKFTDKNENYHILEPYYHVCGKLYNEDIIDSCFYNLLMKIKSDDLKFYDNAWVFCFSLNGYSLFMKERYAPNDGWIIGVSKPAFDFSFPSELGNVNLLKVNYQAERVENELLDVIKDIYRCYKLDAKKNTYGELDKLEQNVKTCVLLLLEKYSCCYKPSDYSREEEVRLVARLKKGFTEWVSSDDEVVLKIVNIEGQNKLHLIINNKNRYKADNRIVFCDDSKYNKTYISWNQDFSDK